VTHHAKVTYHRIGFNKIAAALPQMGEGNAIYNVTDSRNIELW
jgi:hypothetical protein